MMAGLAEALARYGQTVTVCYGDGQSKQVARAVFQPVLERREDWRQEVPTPLGLVQRDRFLYFGEPGVSLESCDYLVWNGGRFRLQSAQPVYMGDELSHWRAVAVPEDGGGEGAHWS